MRARVGAVVVVVVAPFGDQLPGVAQVGEQVLVKALVHGSAGHSAGMSRVWTPPGLQAIF